MNYKPFVSDFVDHSIDPTYVQSVKDEQGNEVLITSTEFKSRYEGLDAESFSIHSRVQYGVGLSPAPAVANALERLTGIDTAVSMVDKLSKQN